MELRQLEELVIKNSTSTAQLVEVSKRTSLDVDRLTKYMDETRPLKNEIHNLQKQQEEIKLKILEQKKTTNEKFEEVEEKFDDLNIIFFALKHPYWIVLTIIGLAVVVASSNTTIPLQEIIPQIK